MKKISLLLLYLFSQTAFAGRSVNGLIFPSNDDQPTRTFIAFQFDDPHLHDLPIWGKDRKGATYMWRYKPFQQNGYYVTFWWSENSDLFTWHGGVSNTYYGGHPYPVGGASGTEHNWEIAGMDTGADHIATLTGSPLPVVKEVWYTQALVIRINDDGSKTARFYIDIPNLEDSRIIEAIATADWGEIDPPHPAITFGDSPWWVSYQNERLSGILGPVKIFNASLSDAEILQEAADMSELKTAAGMNAIWWGKNSFDNIDDLMCDYGTGRTFYWANQNKASLFELKKRIDFDSVRVGDSQSLPLTIYAQRKEITIFDIQTVSGEHFGLSDVQYPVTIPRGGFTATATDLFAQKRRRL